MYIEVAIGSPRKRGLLIKAEDLPDILVTDGKDKPIYRSTYLYYDDAKDYIEISRSLKDFQGVRGIDQVIVDIDKGQNSDSHTQQIAQGAMLDLYELNVQDCSIQPYFSGTGYHLAISNEVFQFKPTKNLPYILKETMKGILKDIDCSVYSRTALYRVEHTLNDKRGFYKVPLTAKELFNQTPDYIKNLAEKRRFDFDYPVLTGDGELSGSVTTHVPQIRELESTFEPKNIVPCIQKIYNDGPLPGTRNNGLLRMASHFLRHGFPSEVAKTALMHWNNDNLDENVVLQKVEDTYNRGYRYGCNDFLLHEYCQPRCVYYKHKDYLTEVKTSDEMQKSLEERMTANYEGRCIRFDELFGISDKDLTVYPGELVTIFGPTGANKTTLAQNIVLGYDAKNDIIRKELQIPTLYLSLELTDWYTHKRHLQIVSGMKKKQIETNFKEIYKFHKDDVSHIVVQTVSPTVEKIKEMVRSVQPRCVVVDYIDLVEPPKHIRGEYESIRYISHSLASLAVNMDLIIIQLSQTSRTYSRDEVLDLYAGKGPGAIENASRKVLGISGNAKRKDRKVELFKNTDGELFDVELEWQPNFRLMRADAIIRESQETNRIRMVK